MSLIVWEKSMELGVAQIDAEHQKIVELIQTIERMIISDNEKNSIEKSLLELLKFTELHFASEETFMIRKEYPDYMWHKKIHERLIIDLKDKVYNLKYEFIDLDLLLKFVIAWFINHTTQEDSRLTKFLLS